MNYEMKLKNLLLDKEMVIERARHDRSKLGEWCCDYASITGEINEEIRQVIKGQPEEGPTFTPLSLPEILILLLVHMEKPTTMFGDITDAKFLDKLVSQGLITYAGTDGPNTTSKGSSLVEKIWKASS